jgi:hypothetical protein
MGELKSTKSQAPNHKQTPNTNERMFKTWDLAARSKTGI